MKNKIVAIENKMAIESKFNEGFTDFIFKDVKNFRKNVNLVLGDACALPFKNKTFDFAICIEGLEHIDDYTRAIDEVARVLKKNSPFLLTTPNGEVVSLKKSNPTHVRHFLPHELVFMLKRKFEDVKIVKRGYFISFILSEVRISKFLLRKRILIFRIPLFIIGTVLSIVCKIAYLPLMSYEQKFLQHKRGGYNLLAVANK
jgi:SAM-dependent methyltransferase